MHPGTHTILIFSYWWVEAEDYSVENMEKIICSLNQFTFMLHLRNETNRKNTHYSILVVFIDQCTSANLVGTSGQNKLATFIVFCCCFQIQTKSSYKISSINCPHVNTGFYFDVTASSGAFPAILPKVCVEDTVTVRHSQYLWLKIAKKRRMWMQCSILGQHWIDFSDMFCSHLQQWNVLILLFCASNCFFLHWADGVLMPNGQKMPDFS